MFGWFSEARARASRSNRARRSGSADTASGKTLTATSRPGGLSFGSSLVLGERDGAGLQIVHSFDQADGARGKHFLQDGALFADFFYGKPHVLLADLVHVGVVLAGSRPGSRDRWPDLGDQLG